MKNLNYSVRVYPFQSSGNTKAFATITFGDVVEVKGIKVVNGSRGLFVSFPQTKGKDKATGEDKWYPDMIFHEDRNPEDGIYKGPVQSAIEEDILKEYQNQTNGSKRGAAAKASANPPAPTKKRPKNPFDSSDDDNNHYEPSDPFSSDSPW